MITGEKNIIPGDRLELPHLSDTSWIDILNLIALPVIGIVGWIVRKQEKAAEKREEKIEADMKALRDDIKSHDERIIKNREEAFEKFMTNRSFDRFATAMEKNMDYMRSRLDDVALAVGAKSRSEKNH